MAAALTGRPPIAVQLSFGFHKVDGYKNAISSGKGHYTKRTECVRELMRVYGPRFLMDAGIRSPASNILNP